MICNILTVDRNRLIIHIEKVRSK